MFNKVPAQLSNNSANSADQLKSMHYWLVLAKPKSQAIPFAAAFSL
jgi:hypothetical protein